MTFSRYDVHIVPFPFSDMAQGKGRPALVLSNEGFTDATGNALFAMITSAKRSRWPGDCEISDLGSAGLTSPSVVRMRLETMAAHRIGERIGRLCQGDIAGAIRSLRATFAL